MASSLQRMARAGLAVAAALAPAAALAGGSNYGVTPGALPAVSGKVSEWPVPTPKFARDPSPGPDGAIYIAVMQGNRIARFDPATPRFVEWELPPGAKPHDLVVDREGLVWYTGNGNGTIGRLDPKTGKVSEFKVPGGGDPHTIVLAGVLEPENAEAMANWAHGGGFSLDASVRIEGADRPGRERLLRTCARPALALERWREIDAEHLVYEGIKPGPGGSISLMLTPPELIKRLAALIPPPRRHRHRDYGVLAPNAPLREQVTALAGMPDGTPAADATGSIAATAAPSRSSEGTEEAPGEAEAILRRIARYAWAVLLARIDEVFPLVCPRFGGERRIIAFVTDAVREILSPLGEPTSPPRLMKARVPPLWERQGANMGEDEAQAQPVPEYEIDQRIAC